MRNCLALVAVLAAVPASAQPIHHHPQKAAYASPAEWPVASGQAHWPNPDPTMTCHLHVDPKFPYGAELDGSPFEVPFTLKLFMCDGRITSFDGEAFAAITWDATGNSTMPDLRGDAMGVRQFTGKVTIAPKQPRNGRFFVLHGWESVRFQATAVLTNGDLIQNNFWTSFYSTADLSQPEVVAFTAAPSGSRDYPILSERANFGPACAFQSPRPPYTECGSWGDMITEINDWLPLAPISAPWTTSTAVYNYTANSDLPNGRYEQRQDLDLHNGIRGSLIDSGNNGLLGFTNRLVVFDPAVMGPGPHKEALFWTQPFAATGESASALIALDVTVDLNAPPIVTCQDRTATNFGGPLPCVFPVIDPPPLCTDPKATNVGGPLPCVFPPPPAVGAIPAGTYTLCNAAGACSVLIIR